MCSGPRRYSAANVRARAARASAPARTPCVRNDPKAKPPPWKQRRPAARVGWLDPRAGDGVGAALVSGEPRLQAIGPHAAQRLADVPPAHDADPRHHRPGSAIGGDGGSSRALQAGRRRRPIARRPSAAIALPTAAAGTRMASPGRARGGGGAMLWSIMSERYDDPLDQTAHCRDAPGRPIGSVPGLRHELLRRAAPQHEVAQLAGRLVVAARATRPASAGARTR